MSKPIQVSASILCADFTRLDDEIKKSESAGVDGIHIDVMDGHFVPPITIGQVIVEAIRPKTKLPIETHLMVEDPWFMIDSFIDAGADIISLQVECYGERRAACRAADQYPKEVDRIDAEKLRRDIRKIHSRGKKVHLVVNPGTPLCFDMLLGEIDGVLVMSVNPGFAKQKFMPVTIPKIEELRKKFKGDIAVDGGVNGEIAPLVVKAGANVLATASYFFSASNPKELVKGLKSLR